MTRVKWVNRIFLLTVFVSFFGGIISSLVASAFENNVFVRILLYQTFLILPTAYYIKQFKLNVKEAIRIRRVSLSNVILLILFAYLITPLMALLNLISMLFVKNTISEEVTNVVNNNNLFFSVFLIALIPCIFEEVVYRGIFYNEYRKVNHRKGILLSALLFGLMHMNFNQFFYAFAMGAIFALLIEATDSILASMIVHFVINGTSVIGSYYLPKAMKYVEDTTGQKSKEISVNNLTMNEKLSQIIMFAFIALFTTALAYIVLKNIAKNCGRYEHVLAIFSRKPMQHNEIKVAQLDKTYEDSEYSEERYHQVIELDVKEKLISAPLIIGMAWCFAMMLLELVLSIIN